MAHNPPDWILETDDGFQFRTVRESPYRLTVYISRKGEGLVGTMTRDSSACTDGQTVDDIPLERYELMARSMYLGSVRALDRIARKEKRRTAED